MGLGATDMSELSELHRRIESTRERMERLDVYVQEIRNDIGDLRARFSDVAATTTSTLKHHGAIIKWASTILGVVLAALLVSVITEGALP